MKTLNLDDLQISRAPLNDYGSLEGLIRAIRASRPLDLNAGRWRRNHPEGTFAESWFDRHLRENGGHSAGSIVADIDPLLRGRRQSGP